MAVHLDFETRSDINIQKLGGYRYANDASTRILMFAVCEEDSEIVLWDHLDPQGEQSMRAMAILQRAIANNDLIYAHNAQFELAITRYRGRKDLGLDALPDIHQWRCTLSMCRRAALPVSLGQAAEILRLDVGKDALGKGLIDVFSTPAKVTLRPPEGMKIFDKSEKGRKPDNRTTPNPLDGWTEKNGTHNHEILWDWIVSVKGTDMTVREAYDRFKSYCRIDVEVERRLHQKLSHFELSGLILESFQFNLKMNDRGIPVNLSALKNAQRLIAQYEKLAHTRFYNMTGLSPTQGAKFKTWMAERGYFADNLQSDTVEGFLRDYSDFLTPEGFKAFSLYRLLNFAALKKIPAMVKSACDDGHVRGTMLWHGARTGRVTGKFIQPQNIKKAKVKTDLAYDMICEGCSLEEFEEFFSSPLEMIASCARHFIHDPGHEFYDCDFVGVEARLTPWAVNDTDKLQSILDGVDQYKRVATMIFKIPYDEITKPQRKTAKPVELGCGFGGSGKAIQEGLRKEGVIASLKEAQSYVKIYRDNHPNTVAAWSEIEEAAKAAIRDGTTTKCLNGMLKMGRVRAAGLVYMVMVLPSGRRLYYPSPRLESKFVKYTVEEMQESEWKLKRGGYWREEIRFWGTIPNTQGKKWGFVSTFGARLFENAIQGLGVDCLDQGCISASKDGFDIFIVVHDQALCYARPDASIEDFEKSFCKVGDWAKTFPLEADGVVVPYYTKDID